MTKVRPTESAVESKETMLKEMKEARVKHGSGSEEYKEQLHKCVELSNVQELQIQLKQTVQINKKYVRK